MSRRPEVREGRMACPLCMEPLEKDEVNFYPCTCRYQICSFCWHRIRTDGDGLCPPCRKPYTEDLVVYTPLTRGELQRIKSEKRQSKKEQKIPMKRKHLGNVHVVQRNLVSVTGLPQRLADPEMLKGPAYFGKFGKVHKVIINNRATCACHPSNTIRVYVTYIKNEDALRALRAIGYIEADGRTLNVSLGMTRYCNSFLNYMPCPKPDCRYLHELGDEDASFTIEDMQANKHHEYEQKLLQENNPQYQHSEDHTYARRFI